MTVVTSNGTTTMDPTSTVFTENEKKLQSNALLAYKRGEDDDDDDEITLEDLAPDGGWGWMVAFAMIVVFVSIYVQLVLNINFAIFLFWFIFHRLISFIDSHFL